MLFKALRYGTRKTGVRRSTIELRLLSSEGLNNQDNRGTIVDSDSQATHTKTGFRYNGYVKIILTATERTFSWQQRNQLFDSVSSIRYAKSYLERITRRLLEITRVSCDPCGGGVEYLHRDPASRRKRRKGKSQIWDSKIWPRVLRDSDPKMTALARASRNCERQTCPLARKGAQNQQTRNCQTIIKIWL
jgi:hypothetical protein